MRILLISRVRAKILLALRMLLALAILAILTGQLYGILKSGGLSGSWHREDAQPNGNPMRVYQESVGEQVSSGTLDGLLNKIKSYYQGKPQTPDK